MADVGMLATKADCLRALHAGPDLLVLPNAWDVPSARSVAAAGFPAVATTSGGIARAHGYADGELIPPAEMFDAVRRIAAAVDVPVTADLEAGYGMAGADLVAEMLDAGVVGLNFEDTDHHGEAALVDATAHAERIGAIKDAGRSKGVDVVVNARVDVFARAYGAPETRVDEAARRGSLYRDAGADCVFPILLADEDAIATLVGELGVINVYVRPGAPPLARLAELGVRRASFGTGVMRATYERLSEITRGIGAGDASALF